MTQAKADPSRFPIVSGHKTSPQIEGTRLSFRTNGANYWYHDVEITFHGDNGLFILPMTWAEAEAVGQRLLAEFRRKFPYPRWDDDWEISG